MGLVSLQTQIMTVPPIVQTLTFLKRLNTYTGDVTVLFVSLSVGLVYILVHQVMSVSA